MKLIIAEKPSVAMDIASILGVNQRKDGYLEGNGYIITWCFGHLVRLAEPDVYDLSLKKWSLNSLPFIPEPFKYEIIPDKSAPIQCKLIIRLMNNTSVKSLINCCDSGREGELIFHLIYLMAGCKKPVERLWISALTKEDIRRGFQNLKPGNNYSGLRDSAHARQRADWLIGMNITRVFTLKANTDSTNEVYTLGRVQTPTLALIVNREQEINNFVAEKFYQVSATFYSQVGSYQGLWVGQNGFRIEDENEANQIVDKVSGQDGVVEKVDKKLVKEKAPLLHDLTSLQRLANTKYGLTAAETLKIAQSLYEAKLITYPRTNCQYISESLVNEIREHLSACDVGIYQQYVRQIEAMGIRLTSRHVDDGKLSDHHALLPTKNKPDLSKLDEDQKKVYDLIVRRFLAAFYPETEAEQTTIFTNVLGEKFVSKGKVILKAGWRVVETPENMASTPANNTKGKSNSSSSNQSLEDEDKLLPPVKQQQPVEVTLAQALEKWTKPPARFTDASLLSTMQTAGKEVDDEVLRQILKDKGLGTPQGRSLIIETLISREYIVREKKVLVPTQKGKLLIELLPSPLLKSPKLTGEWEQKLIQIEKGQYSLKAFMDDIKQTTIQLVKEISEASISGATEQVAREKAENELSCPLCLIEGRDGYLVERSGQYGKFLCCSQGKEICNYISNVPKNQKQRKALVESRCPNCDGATKLHLPKEKDKSPVLLCLNYNQCKGIVRLDEPNNNSVSDRTTNKNTGSFNQPSSYTQSGVRNNSYGSNGSYNSNSYKSSNNSNNSSSSNGFNRSNGSNNNRQNNTSQPQNKEMGPACKVCGKPTVKRSFKDKQGGDKPFWGCCDWKPNNQGCNAQPVWIN